MIRLLMAGGYLSRNRPGLGVSTSIRRPGLRGHLVGVAR
jgi:hypothetical protein